MRTLPLREGAPGPGALFSSDPSLQRQRHFFSPHPGIVTACPVIRHGPRHQFAADRNAVRSRAFPHKVRILRHIRRIFTALLRRIGKHCSYISRASGPCFYMNFFRLLPGARMHRSTTGFCVSPISSRRPLPPSLTNARLAVWLARAATSSLTQKSSYEVEPRKIYRVASAKNLRNGARYASSFNNNHN
jgi:hypothetical protein